MSVYRLLCFLFPVLLTALQAKASEEERSFIVINASNGLADNSAQVVKCTSNGRIIISTIGNLNFFDGKSFTHADTKAEYEYELPSYEGHYHLYFDDDNHIWLKDKHKVMCLDLMSEKYVNKADSIIKSKGCSSKVLDLFVDQLGSMWFVTEEGLFSARYKRTYHVLRDRILQDIDVADNTVYFFYDNGEVLGTDTLGNTVCRVKAYEGDMVEKYSGSSVLQPFGDGFFQIRNGDKGAILLFFSAKENTYETVMEIDHHLNNMTIDSKGELVYIPSEYGYYVYHPDTKEVEHVPEVQLSDGQTMATDCNAMTFDHQGGLWIGTEKRGVLYARPHSLSIRAYPWSDDRAMTYGAMLYEAPGNTSISYYDGIRANCELTSDSRGWKWIGTRLGLFIEQPGGEKLHYSRSNGLNNEVVHSIIEDQDHNMWVATSCGITFFLIDDGKIVFINNFTSNDNVPDESFENCKVMMLDDGTILMQAVEHVVEFNPKNLKDVNVPHVITNLKPKLVRMLMNGNDVVAGKEYDGHVIVDRAMTRVEHINLKSDQNSIALTFSALNYYRPIQTYYRVRVKELGNEWQVYSTSTSSQVDDRGLLHYPMVNLKPGDYHVEVQASLFPDQWQEDLPDDQRFVWIVHVKEPWWRTTGLYVLLGAVLLALLIVNFYFFNKNTRMRVRRNSEEGDIIRKIRFFAERCEDYANRPLTPVGEDLSGASDSADKLNPEFIDIMIKLIPFINTHNERQLNMRQLSEAGGVDIVKLYGIVSGNLYKNPRELARVINLQKAAELLSTTDMSIEQIAMECKFYTPNYFIGNFFHEYKMTPQEYRRQA